MVLIWTQSPRTVRERNEQASPCSTLSFPILMPLTESSLLQCSVGCTGSRSLFLAPPDPGVSERVDLGDALPDSGRNRRHELEMMRAR
jgi:hypothetical protein